MASDSFQVNFIRSNCLFTWVFRHLNSSKTPELSEIPKELELENFCKQLEEYWNYEQTRSSPSFIRALFKLIWKEMLYCCILHSIAVIQKTFMAVMIKEIIDYMQEDSSQGDISNLLIAGMVMSSFIMTVCMSNCYHRLLLLTGRVRCGLTLSLSKKCLKIKSQALEEGKIMNILSSDLELFELFLYTPFAFDTVICVIVASLLLSYIIGSYAVIGIAISIAHIPFIFLLSIYGSKIRTQISKISDKRIKLIINLLEGIKVFKFYAWEMLFVEKICAYRKKEIEKRYLLNVFNGFMSIFGLGGITLAIFLTFYINLTWLEKTLTLGEMYLIIIVYLSNHLAIVHMNTIAILTLVLLKGVLKRFGDIFLLPEIAVETDCFGTKAGLTLVNVCVSKNTDSKLLYLETEHFHSNDDEILTGVTFEVTSGTLLIITGPTGSGKTCLLKVILRELEIHKGRLDINGKLSYCCEQPWIVSASFKDNILMGETFNSEKYFKVLRACSLDKDIECFSYKDETWVGDRGVTLSGGQKARLNLARALYRDFDTIILDDPLSSVDAQVSNHIFNECLLKLKSEGKTVILVTHQLQYLEKADKILILEKGSLSFFGKFSELESQVEILQKMQDFREKVKDEQQDIPWHDLSILDKQEEEEMDEKLKFKSVFLYLKGGFSSFLMFIIALLLISVVQLTFQELLYWCSHREDLAEKSDEHFLRVLGFWTLGVYLSLILSSCYILNLITRCNHVLHDKSLKSLAATFITFFDKNPSGRIINRFSKDVSNSDGPLQFFIYDSTNAVGLVISSIIVQVYLIPYLLIVIPFYLLIQAGIFCKVSGIIAKLRKRENLSKGPILSTMASNLEGLASIRSQRIQDAVSADFHDKVSHYFKCFITYNSFIRFAQFYSDLAGLIIVIVNVVLIVKADGIIELGLAAYSLSASMNIVSISSMASKDLLELSSLMFSPQHLIEYQQLLPEKIDGMSDFKITQGVVEFKDVVMRYQPRLPIVLHNLSIFINSREKVGIVGRTGSGKSSILNVLCRLIEPESGTIYIDGQDYKKIGLHQLRKQFSIIPQSAVLFASSLRDNLDPLQSFTDDEIWDVLKLVGLEQLCSEDDNLSKQVGGKGINLSAGQKQLITIARALLVKNKIVMIDEATSNIDIKTDHMIQTILKTRFEDSSLLVIAHRLLTVVNCDKIAVMDNGRCIEFAPALELYDDKNSEFFKLCEISGISRESLINN